MANYQCIPESDIRLSVNEGVAHSWVRRLSDIHVRLQFVYRLNVDLMKVV